MRYSLYCNYRFSSLYEWESMAALLTVHRKIMKFGTLVEVVLNSNQTNSCVSTIFSIVPPPFQYSLFLITSEHFVLKTKFRVDLITLKISLLHLDSSHYIIHDFEIVLYMFFATPPLNLIEKKYVFCLNLKRNMFFMGFVIVISLIKIHGMAYL